MAFFIVALVPALAACRAPSHHYKALAAAKTRLPIKAVVWQFNDQTPASADSLTKTGSAWRAPLYMDFLSSALATDLEARLVESARVEVNSSDQLILAEHGTSLYLEGTVEEASWTRSASGQGSYRLKIALSATLARNQAPTLQGFWTKTVYLEEPQRLLPADDMAGVLAQAYGGAVEELGQALAKEQTSEAER